MDEQQITERLEALKRAAWDERDFDTVDLYTQLLSDRKLFRAVGLIIAALYKNTGDEDVWNALHDALFDASLLEAHDA